MRKKIVIPLLEWQRKVFWDKSFFRICICGRGSGKTALLGAEAFVSALQGQQVIIAAPTLRQTSYVVAETKKIAWKYDVPVLGKADGIHIGKGSIRRSGISGCKTMETRLCSSWVPPRRK
jgi:hypothetical protein